MYKSKWISHEIAQRSTVATNVSPHETKSVIWIKVVGFWMAWNHQNPLVMDVMLPEPKKVSSQVTTYFPKGFFRQVINHNSRNDAWYSSSMLNIPKRCWGRFFKVINDRTNILMFRLGPGLKFWIDSLKCKFQTPGILPKNNQFKLLKMGETTGCGGLPEGETGEQCWSLCFENDCNSATIYAVAFSLMSLCLLLCV